MKKLEKSVHRVLSRWPKLKELVKIFYQALCISVSERRSHINSKVWKKFPDAFVGFHDVRCYSSVNSKTVFHMVKDNKRKKLCDADSVEICIYDLETNTARIVDTTYAFNWQMGSRLQLSPSDEVIWNNIEDNWLRSKAIENDKIVLKPFSIFAVSSQNIAATVNFSNIEKLMPGYGYVGNYEESCRPNEILIWDLHSAEKLRILYFQELLHTEFITHLQFNKEGNLLAFFIRGKSKNYSFSTILVVYDWENGIEITRTHDVNVITHFTWLDTKILMYCLYEGKFRYITYDVYEQKYIVLDHFDNLPDGHPSYLPKKGLVTDTYPDRQRLQTLYYSKDIDTPPKILGKFYSPLYYRGYSRVDLHPRLHENEIVSIDCVDNGRVSTFLLKPN